MFTDWGTPVKINTYFFHLAGFDFELVIAALVDKVVCDPLPGIPTPSPQIYSQQRLGPLRTSLYGKSFVEQFN